MSVKRIDQIAKVRRGASPRPIDDPKYFGGEVGWVRIVDVSASRKYLRKTSQYVSTLGESLSVRVDKGDLIMSIAGTVGRPIIIDIPACIHDGFVHLYDLQEVSSEYLYYCLKFIEPTIASFGQSGTQTNLNSDIVRQLKFNVPSPAEQARIAHILSTVDAAIEQTEALITKYTRVRTGLMQDLLTRKIDTLPTYPLAQLADVSAGITLGKKHEGEDTVERPYLRVANVQDGYLNLSDITHIRIPKGQLDRYELKSGDVLMNEGGDFDKLGRGTVWRDEIPGCLHQNHVFRVRCYQDTLLPDYLALVSASPYGKRFFVLNSKQSTNLASINSTQLKSFPIPLPSLDEQQRLLNIFNQKAGVLKAHQQQVAKLQTLKKSLMQALLSEPEVVKNVPTV